MLLTQTIGYAKRGSGRLFTGKYLTGGRSINNWSNSFVHTTYIYSSYIQFYALKTINVLFSSKSKSIKIYTGKNIRKFDCADIKITNYNSLKTDFENSLKSRMPDIVVDWMKTEKVGAYIISE